MTGDDQESSRPILVLKVLSPSKVVINRGNRDGVQRGQRFLIYEIGEEMFDPATEESLGRLEIVRGRGEVVYVQDKMAHVASTETRTKRHRSRNSLSILSSMGIVDEEIVDEPFQDPQEGDLGRPI